MKIAKRIIYPALCLSSFAYCLPLAKASETELNIRAAHYDREFSNASSTRTQTGIGISLKHQHFFFDGRVALSAAAYHAQKIDASGSIREDLLTLDNGELSSFSLLGEASISFQAFSDLTIEVGRVQHESLFIKSKTRLLPSTFEGVNLNWNVSDNFQFYAHRFTKWSPRANPDFQSFATQTSEQGAINNLLIAGLNAQIQLGHSSRLILNSEVLNSDNYLRKLGLVSTLNHALNETQSFELEAALLSSEDAGSLFISGSSSSLDNNLDNNDPNSDTRIEHSGLGAYLSLNYSSNNHSLGVTVSRFGDAWIEDNFDGDHGTTPFPTRTFGPELSNTNETVWLANYKYKWTSGRLRGLSTKLAYAKGSGAENSISAELGQANEAWWYTELRYRAPWTKGFEARVRYRDYRSSIDGEVAGVASDRNELRLDINYKLAF